MKTSYNVEIQMCGECETTEIMASQVCGMLGCADTAIDERELYRMTVLFSSEMTIHEIRKRIERVFYAFPSIFYIDLIWTPYNESLPQRTTYWGDGKIQNYRTRIVYEEVN